MLPPLHTRRWGARLPLTRHVEGRSAMRKRLLVLLMGLLMVVMSASPAFAKPGKARATDRHINDRACQTPAEGRSPVIGSVPEPECEVYPDQGPGRGFPA
jgi:hypothetical protein